MEEIIRELLEKHDLTSVDISYYLFSLLAIGFRYIYLLGLKANNGNSSNTDSSITDYLSNYYEYLDRIQRNELSDYELQILSDLARKLVDLPRFLPQSHTDWLQLAENLLQNICNENNVEIITYATLLPLSLFMLNHFPHREIFELIWNDSLLSRIRWPSVHFTPTMAGGSWQSYKINQSD